MRHSFQVSLYSSRFLLPRPRVRPQGPPAAAADARLAGPPGRAGASVGRVPGLHDHGAGLGAEAAQEELQHRGEPARGAVQEQDVGERRKKERFSSI